MQEIQDSVCNPLKIYQSICANHWSGLIEVGPVPYLMFMKEPRPEAGPLVCY